MGVLESVKEMADVLRKIDNVDLYRQILDHHAEILQLGKKVPDTFRAARA
jgi:hypothetical protein